MTRLAAEPLGNEDYAWDEFEPELYADKNYGSLREDDHELLVRVRDFFAAHVTGRGLKGIDVGTGANLYPALAMLPYCAELTLWERGGANRRWLKDQITRPDGYGRSWDDFWSVLAEVDPYRGVDDPRAALSDRVVVRNGNVFNLPKQRVWQVGTMFFVAESITARRHEFQVAARRFVKSLQIGAPFAAAFMKNSQGYTVGTHSFPAVAVDEAEVRYCLSLVADIVEIVEVTSLLDAPPLRDGYEGMILALGRARRLPS
jgi:hypothetical protein